MTFSVPRRSRRTDNLVLGVLIKYNILFKLIQIVLQLCHICIEFKYYNPSSYLFKETCMMNICFNMFNINFDYIKCVS